MCICAFVSIYCLTSQIPIYPLHTHTQCCRPFHSSPKQPVKPMNPGPGQISISLTSPIPYSRMSDIYIKQQSCWNSINISPAAKTFPGNIFKKCECIITGTLDLLNKYSYLTWFMVIAYRCCVVSIIAAPGQLAGLWLGGHRKRKEGRYQGTRSLID